MINFRMTGDLKEYAQELASKGSPRHTSYMLRHIAGRVVHAEITYNFYMGGRPARWKPLSAIYAMIKAKRKIVPYPNRQPKELGTYPTPFGKINVRAGQLFNTLGTIFRATPTSLVYGTTAPHAADVSNGSVVKRIEVEYDRRYAGDVNGERGSIHVSYYKDLKKPVHVPARPFNYISPIALDAIASTMAHYVVGNSKRQKTVIIPKIGPQILAPGGHRVTIMGRS
jgi:hypothetical protein